MPTITWPIRHAMVVSGAGSGSGNSKSATSSPAPAAMAERASDRGRMLHVSGPGSHRYSSSVRSARLGRTWFSQWKVSCSSISLVQFMAPVYDPFPDTDCQLSGSSFGRRVPAGGAGNPPRAGPTRQRESHDEDRLHVAGRAGGTEAARSEEHTSELQSLMRTS